jgi:YgiT-type zinc finger domain-containing protein
MTGKLEKGKVKRCPLCGGEMKDGITTIPFLSGERVTVIKNVPAEICADCGEAYMKSSVVDKIESLLDRVEALHSEMSVLHYEAA